MTERFTVDSDGKWWDRITHEYVTLDNLFRTVEELDNKLESKQHTINEMAKTIRIYDDGYIDLNKKYKKLKDENEQLKFNIQDMQTGTYINARNIIRELKEENEQLKQYIYDNLDEDICDVCSYQYLEKSKMDKYYVAKCKKGYDNCSKGTVIHCKDFKFKELKSE